MADFVELARTSDIPPGTGKTLQVGGVAVAVFNVEGRFHAIPNACPHRQGPLGEGELSGTVVTCPWHGWTYDLTSGQCLNRAGVKVPCFEVRVEGQALLIKMGGAEKDMRAW